MSISEVIEEVKTLSPAERQELLQKLSEIAPRVEIQNGAEAFNLNRAQPKQVYKRRVQYKLTGKGKPKPFPLDDEK